MSEHEAVDIPEEKVKNQMWRRFKKNKPAVVGLVFILIIILAAIFANVLFDFNEVVIRQNAANRLQPPNADNWFGTDAFGRDMLARIVHGSRVSLTIGLFTTLISMTIACVLGAISAFYGRLLDDVIMRILDVFMCIPGMLLMLAMVAALGPGLVNLLIAIAISSVPGFTRLIRSVILSVVGQEFIEAARASGCRDMRIIIRHILPNAMGPIIINGTMSIAGLILAGAGLSFLGMGVQPPRPEWGSMLAEARAHMGSYPHLVIFPGLAIIFTSLSFNLVGDGLRDALDPRLKN